MSEMTKLTSDYLFLKTTSASTLELKLLPLNDSVKVICAVSTYSAPAADSQITFYDTNWHELPLSDFLQLPQEDEFYLTPASTAQADSLKNLRAYADMYLWKLNCRLTNRCSSSLILRPTIWTRKPQKI